MQDLEANHASVRPRARRAWWSVLGVLALVAALMLALQPSTGAVADVRSATPGPSARVGQPPDRIDLELDRPWLPGAEADISVVGPDDVDLATGRPVATARGLSQPLAAGREEGAYQVVYRVRTADGAVSTGSYWFVHTPHAVASGRRVTALACLGLLVLLSAVTLRRRTRPHSPDPAPAAEVLGTPQPAPLRVPQQRRPTDVAPAPGPAPAPVRAAAETPHRSVGRAD